MVAGFHVPAIELVEVPSNVPGVSPTQYGPKAVNVGIIFPTLTVISIVTLVAHWPPAGVNVYVVVPAEAVFTVSGLHVPVIPLVDVRGRVPGVSPSQYGPSAENAGVTLSLTITVTGVRVAEVQVVDPPAAP